MKILSLTVGKLATNCHLVWDERTQEGVVIDPGGDGGLILAEIAQRKVRVGLIVNTHGHGDHIGANRMVKERTGAHLLIHRGDAKMLANPARNFSLFLPGWIKSPPADRFLEEGDLIGIGQVELRVLHTPGHSPGGICLVGQGIVFAGDTLFAGSIGRTDLPGGSLHQLLRSIREKLLPLPDETMIYPGHGPPSTIGQERRGNPFLTGEILI